MSARSLTRLVAVVSVALAIAACGGAAQASQSGGGGSTGGGPAAASSGEASTGGGANGYEGNLVTSGVYSATWTPIVNAPANPFNAIGNLTVASDKGTFGNINVGTDGSVSFGSAATELKDGSYDGSGARVTLDKGSQFVCAFTVDADLKGSTSGEILHMSGSMTVHWHPEGIGDLSCP